MVIVALNNTFFKASECTMLAFDSMIGVPYKNEGYDIPGNTYARVRNHKRTAPRVAVVGEARL